MSDFFIGLGLVKSAGTKTATGTVTGTGIVTGTGMLTFFLLTQLSSFILENPVILDLFSFFLLLLEDRDFFTARNVKKCHT